MQTQTADSDPLQTALSPIPVRRSKKTASTGPSPQEGIRLYLIGLRRPKNPAGEARGASDHNGYDGSSFLRETNLININVAHVEPFKFTVYT